MLRVRYSNLALADLEGIAAYIAKDSETATRRVIGRLQEVCRKIGEVPGMGRMSEVPPARKLTVPPWRYKILYEINDAKGEVMILRVYHGARNLPY